MEFVRVILFCLVATLYSAEATLTVPGELMSPLGVPTSTGPAGLNAIKLAVGGRLLNMLGSVGLGSIGSLPAGLLGSQNLGGGFPGLGQFGQLPLMPRSADFSKRRGPNIPQTFDIRQASPTEIENFFAVLDKVDSNKCISRLVCEVGANPKVLEDLGHNIKDAMSSLRILEKNALSSKYKQILLQGQKGSVDQCARNFKTCDRRSYRLVKAFVKAFRARK